MLNMQSGRRIFIFAKDLNGRFLFCNEPHAEIAGLDSPVQIVGKTDYDLFWKKHAAQCQKGDKLVIAGKPWQNNVENLSRYDGTFDILINKYRLLDKNNQCIGVIGSYYDIKKYNAKKIILQKNIQAIKKRFFLGETFANEYFTAREHEVFKHILLGKSMKEIARDLHISPKTAEYHIGQIKRKLGCTYKNEITLVAIRHGLVSLNF